MQQGLATDPDIACRVAALYQRDRAAGASAKTLGAALRNVFAKGALARSEAERKARVLRLVRSRAELAERIALAYLELRRLQQIHVLRANLLDQYRDNTDVAEFRRQAGLVPALDGALARTQDETAKAELGYIDGRLGDALADLAQLVGQDSAVLASHLGETAPLPPALDNPTDAPGAAQRVAELNKTLEAARRTVKDARSAYREGAAGFASLYVAEVAVLSAEQALVDTHARNAAATIREWSARDREWASADLDGATPAPPASPGVIDCD